MFFIGGVSVHGDDASFTVCSDTAADVKTTVNGKSTSSAVALFSFTVRLLINP